MATYAKKTETPVVKSRAEIERVLIRYGASHFAYMVSPEHSIIGFQAANRRVKFVVPMPNPKAREFTHATRGKYAFETERSDGAALAAWDQACRQRWRALLLVIKAKLEAVEVGIATFEEEFLAHIVLPNGQTIGEAFIPQIEAAYESGRMPAMQIGWDG